MISLEKLAALDLLIWQRSLERAAQLACTDQSTISRRSRTTLKEFGVSLRRGQGDWRLLGDTQLLGGERRVHQRARFLGHEPLRLQVPYWTQHAGLRALPDGWCANPPCGAKACDDPVTLLRQRVIDACLLTPTQIPEHHDDLLVLDLYRRPIELTLFSAEPWEPPFEALLDGNATGLALRLMPYLPHSCRLRSGEWFDALTGPGTGTRRRGGRPAPSKLEAIGVAFLTPEMRAPLPQPWRVEEAFEPMTYVERLAVLREHRSETAVQRLQEHLLEKLEPGMPIR